MVACLEVNSIHSKKIAVLLTTFWCLLVHVMRRNAIMCAEDRKHISILTYLFSIIPMGCLLPAFDLQYKLLCIMRFTDIYIHKLYVVFFVFISY
jgi:hypothetical protein